jgi:hypothetical protein
MNWPVVDLRGGNKPRPAFLLLQKSDQARERNSCATLGPTMKISENPMASEFCILNVVSRTEVVANATRRGESQCEGGRPSWICRHELPGMPCMMGI